MEKKEKVPRMSWYTRLTRSFEGALRLPLSDRSRYVLISDCHRGTGTSNDNFLKNQNLYFAALQHYYRSGYTYIELGDGDELWENRSMEQIMDTHSNVFWLLSLFYREGRLYLLYGNHDLVKKNERYARRNFDAYRCSVGTQKLPLFPDMPFYGGLILEDIPGRDGQKGEDVYLTHGHQSELINSTLWKGSRFLVRYVWKPLERFGVLDPTSAARNYKRKHKAEKRLHRWAEAERHILITGHTHRPALLKEDPWYYNSGSCVHPRCITCLEIEYKRIRLVKWTLATRPDRTLYVAREVLAGPLFLNRQEDRQDRRF